MSAFVTKLRRTAISAALRPVSNLAEKSPYQLDRKSLKQNFFFFYNRGFGRKEHPVAVFSRIALGYLMPGLLKEKSFGRDKRRINGYYRNHDFAMLAQGVQVQKMDGGAGSNYVSVRIPVLVVRDEVFSGADAALERPPEDMNPFDFATQTIEYLKYEEEYEKKLAKDAGGQDFKRSKASGTILQQVNVFCNSESMANQKYMPMFEGHPVDPDSILTHFSEYVNKFITPLIKGTNFVPARQLWQCLPKEAKMYASEAFVGLYVSQTSSCSVFYVALNISEAEACHMCATNWDSVRPMDLSNMLVSWVASGYGSEGDIPTSSRSLSHISRSLPEVAHEDARVNELSLSISPNGQIYLLPEHLKEADSYETKLLDIGDRGDHFCLHPAEELVENRRADLPTNMPILMDWVNMKFVYTNTSGELRVQDLSRFQPANASHVKSVLNRQYGLKSIADIARVIRRGGFSNLDTQLTFAPDTMQLLNDAETNGGYSQFMISQNFIDVEEYLRLCNGAYAYEAGAGESKNFVPGLFDIKPDTFSIYSPVLQWAREAIPVLLGSPEVVYDTMSVVNALNLLGTLSAIYHYVLVSTEAYQHTHAEVARLHQAAHDGNSVDARGDFDPGTIPLLDGKGFGFLPHQKKVRHRLAGSPNFAIIPVPPGGGKTPLIVSDICIEMKHGRSAPYLILCPTHLVAQYVKEINYFTKGKLNCIPVTNFAWRYQTPERMTKMIENAPINTVVICSYDTLRNRQTKICYGTETVIMYPVIEFLRQFRFQYVAMDESHYLKNDSNRSRAAQALISEIPKKRLASGTMAHSTPADLARQIAMIDPTLLGSDQDFQNAYAEEVSSGGKITRWKEGAEEQLLRDIKTKVVVAGAQQREWAALLPQPKERFHIIDMTDKQKAVYADIMQSTIEEMKRFAETNALMAEFLNKTKAEVEKALEADPFDEEAEERLATMLRPFLARLEQFTTAPGADKVGSQVLTGDDALSPKIHKTYDILREHLAQKIPGKVIIFTNYVASAEAVYDNMPPDLKQHALLYVAAEKTEAGARFDKDPNILFMVGVAHSMDTGLNLQIASRLIRLEYPFNPGTLKQGNARIFRPELKTRDVRTAVYFDWICANNSVDITKVGRLVSKLLSVSRFENAGNHFYDGVPDLDIVPLNLESIFVNNEWHTTMGAYADAYRVLNTCQARDYEAFKNDPRNAFERDENGNVVIRPVKGAPPPEGSGAYDDVTYVQGGELAYQNQLGLIRLDVYLRQEEDPESDSGDDDEGGDEEEETEGQPTGPTYMERLMTSLEGKPCHCEFGEGSIIGIRRGGKNVRVRMENGLEAIMRCSMVFLKPDNMIGTDIRKAIANHNGLELKNAGPLPHANIFHKWLKTAAGKAWLANGGTPVARTKGKSAPTTNPVPSPNEPAVESLEMACDLTLSVTNGFLSVVYHQEEGEDHMLGLLENLGFRKIPQFYFAEIKNARMLITQFENWKEAGFTISKPLIELGTQDAFARFWDELRSGKVHNHRDAIRFATQTKLRNFYRMETKPSADPKVIKPFPLIENERGYICLPISGQKGTVEAIKAAHKAPSVRWMKSHPELMFFASRKADVNALVKKLLAKGVNIRNLEEMQEQVNELAQLRFRTYKEDDESSDPHSVFYV